MIGKNGVYIQPNLAGYSVTNFAPVAELIKKGYDATMADIPKKHRRSLNEPVFGIYVPV